MLLTTIKITPAARLCLRRVAARTEEKHYQVLDRLLKQEEMQLRSLLARNLPVTQEQYQRVSGILRAEDLYPTLVDPAK